MSANTSNSSKRFVSLAPGSGAQSTSGSNRAQWNAMDLHIGWQQQGSGYNASAARNISQFPAAGGVATGAGGALAGMKVENTGLSARNILIRRKLMERKRFDSADYAMSKSKEENGSNSKSNATDVAMDNRPVSAPYSPAQVGASVFFSALGADDTDEPMDDDAQQPDVNAQRMPSRASRYTLQQAPAAAARGAASRYGNLEGPAGGALSARNILIQKKLCEKKHFDSADYQLAQFKSSTVASPPLSTDGNLSVDRDDDGDDTAANNNSTASPMEIDLTPLDDSTVANINSPSAASVAMRRNMSAQMSPSVRGGKYGGLSGASELLRRTLSDKKKRLDSADCHMEKNPMAVRDDTSAPFYVPATRAAKYGAVAAPPAPQAMAPGSSGAKGGTSDYGKLCAANVLIRKKLKERKRFDSADYAMEKQGHHNDNDVPSSLPRDAQCMGMGNTPTAKHHESAISHQVKHIKLSEESGGWAARVPVSNVFPAGAISASSSTMPKSSNTAHGDGSSRLVARNIIIQRKLAERKRFDSADYFKEAAGSRR
ncbi:Er membrane protein complex subunit 2, partial [Globisporangium splendens]